MSRIAFLTRDFAFSQVVPPSRSSAGRAPPVYFWIEIEALDRHEQLGVVVVAELEKFLRALAAAHAELFEADELADPVIHVHDEIAHLEVAQVGEKRLGHARASLAGTALLVEDVALDVDLQRRVGEPEPARHGAHGHEHRRGMRLFGALDRHGHDVVVPQDLHGALGPPGTLGDEEHGVAALPCLTHVGDPVADAPVKLHRRLAANLAQPGARLAERQLLELRRRLESLGQVVPRHESRFGRGKVGAAPAAGVGVARLELLAHPNGVLGDLLGLRGQQAHAP